LMLEAPDPTIGTWLDRQARSSIWTSAVTVFEIRYGLVAMTAGRRQSLLSGLFDRLISDRLEQRILSFDAPAADEAAKLMADRERGGKSRDLRDTMIAGIALANNATLATRNVRQFDDLRVPVVDPWHA
jgi:predicted nucleic acid-binding protein